MSASQEKSLRDLVDGYSPIVRGKKGLFGRLLHALAAPVEFARNVLHVLNTYPYHFGHENTAGQVVTDCPFIVPVTYGRMESRLQAGFNAAARPGASPIDRENFLHLAEHVTRDAAELAKHCTILRTEFACVTEPYNFIVKKEALAD